MKRIFYTTALLTFITILLSSMAASCQKKDILLTITHIEREDSISEVYAKRGYQLWMAKCRDFPDSIKIGMKLQAQWIKKEDSCKCIFKRIK